MKRILLWMLAVVVLAGAGAAFLVTRIDADFIVRRIAEATQSVTGAPLHLDAPPHISLLPPGIRFGAARWSGSLDGCAVSVSLQGGMARLELGPLFSGTLVLNELQLDRPEVDIRLTAAAPAAGDTATTETPPAESISGAAPTSRKAPDDALPLTLARLTVTQGALRLEDGERETRIAAFNLSLKNLRRREEASLQGDLVLELRETRTVPPTGGQGGSGTEPLLAGNLAFKGSLRYYAPNLTFRQVSLAFTPLKGAIPRALAPLQLTCDGALDLGSLGFRLAQARLSTPQARLTLQGRGTLTPVAFAGDVQLTGSPHQMVDLAGATRPEGVPDSLDIHCRTEYAGNTLRLAGLAGEVAGVSVGGDMTLGLPAPPEQALAIRGALRLGTLALDTWFPAGARAQSSPSAAGKTPARQGAGATTDSRKTTTGLPTIDLRLSIAGLRHGMFGLQDLSTHITGKAGRYSLNSLTTRLTSGGALQGDLTADMGARVYSVAASGSGVDIGTLCAAAGKAGLAGGSAAFTVRLKSSGVDSRALLASLDGEGMLEVRSLTSPALREASQTLSKLPVANIGIPERIDTARVPFTARKGEISAQPVTIAATGLSARGVTHVSLPRETLEGSATVSTLGLNIPLIFKGPFSDISVSVDPKFALELGRKLGSLPGVSGTAGKTAKEEIGAAGNLVRGLLGR